MSPLLRRTAVALMFFMVCMSASARVARAASYAPITYVGTAVANVFYFPAKLVFATTGAVTSGVTYLVTFGSEEPTRTIWDSSVHGDYFVTPDMVSGHEPIEFVG